MIGFHPAHEIVTLAAHFSFDPVVHLCLESPRDIGKQLANRGIVIAYETAQLFQREGLGRFIQI